MDSGGNPAATHPRARGDVFSCPLSHRWGVQPRCPTTAPHSTPLLPPWGQTLLWGTGTGTPRGAATLTPLSLPRRVSPGPGLPLRPDMAAGVIRPLAGLRLPSPFPHGLLLPARPEPDFPDLSEEEEEDDEEEEEEEDEEEAAEDSTSCRGLELAGPNAAEATLRLLRFSELISGDIQRYFGRRGQEEPAGGRGTPEDCSSPQCTAREPGTASLPQPEAVMARGGSGATQRLGPLAELFEYGVHRCLPPRAAGGKTQRLERKYGHITPMHRRKLPPSFWKEPGPGPASLLHTGTPDFSDLLANWTVEPGLELPGAGRELLPEPGRLGLDTEPFVGL